MTEYFSGFFMLQFALVLSLVRMNIQVNIKKAKCKIVQRELIKQTVGHIEHQGRSSSGFGKEVKLNLGTMHGKVPMVYEDFSLKKSFTSFTSTSGNEKIKELRQCTRIFFWQICPTALKQCKNWRPKNEKVNFEPCFIMLWKQFSFS